MNPDTSTSINFLDFPSDTSVGSTAILWHRCERAASLQPGLRDQSASYQGQMQGANTRLKENPFYLSTIVRFVLTYVL